VLNAKVALAEPGAFWILSALTMSSPLQPGQETLKRFGKNYEFHRYDGAGHSFFDWHKPPYRPEQAVDGWRKVFTFLDKHLAASAAKAAA
jgi:dienelactone hydrolase